MTFAGLKLIKNRKLFLSHSAASFSVMPTNKGPRNALVNGIILSLKKKNILSYTSKAISLTNVMCISRKETLFCSQGFGCCR